MYRGSRKHILDWTARASFLDDLKDVLYPLPITTSADSKFMPQGYKDPKRSTFGELRPSVASKK